MRTAAWWLAGLLLVALVIAGSASSGKSAAWTTYRGAWFTIKYPPGFKARPSLRSRTAPQGYDSVFFHSPEGLVEFYVFSPQWNGEPQDIEIDPRREVYVSLRITEKGEQKIRHATMRAKNNSYTRALADVEHTQTNTRVVFGFKYRDRKAYARYRPTYLTFKKSLVQYAD